MPNDYLSSIDYQQIVDITAQALAVALPIGLITGFMGKICNIVIDFALGKERVRL